VDECKPLVSGHGGGHRQAARQPGGQAPDGVPQARGRAAQVDPIKPTLKAPGTKRLKLKYDEPLSKFAFKFNLRRYSEEGNAAFKSGQYAEALKCYELAGPGRNGYKCRSAQLTTLVYIMRSLLCYPECPPAVGARRLPVSAFQCRSPLTV
jgi:hypothetical protein